MGGISEACGDGAIAHGIPKFHALADACHTVGYIPFGGDLASTGSIVRVGCESRTPVGLVNQSGKPYVRTKTNSHSPPNLVR